MIGGWTGAWSALRGRVVEWLSLSVSLAIETG